MSRPLVGMLLLYNRSLAKGNRVGVQLVTPDRTSNAVFFITREHIMTQKYKSLTRQEIANLYIDANFRLAEIHWQFRTLAYEENYRRKQALKKLGYKERFTV